MVSTMQNPVDNKENVSGMNIIEIPCTKRARVEEPTQEESNPEAKIDPVTIDLTANLVSGNTLGVISVPEQCTGPMLRSMLQAFVDEDKTIDSLLIGSSTFGDDVNETAKDRGLSTGSVVQVTLREPAPTAHLLEPCSAAQLSGRHGSWCIGGGSDGEQESEEGCPDSWSGYNLCKHGVHHKGMDAAPKAGREVAEEMHASIHRRPILLVKGGNNYGETEEIIVISNPGNDAKTALLQALAIREEDLRFDREGNELGRLARKGKGFNVWECAEVTLTDWSKDVAGSWSRDVNHDDSYLKEAVDLTDVMAKRLTRHFQFGFPYGLLTSPVFFGGFAYDGSIVGILAYNYSR